MKRKNTFILSSILTLFFAASCKKYVALDTPPVSVGIGEAFSDSSTATSVVLGLYGGIASANGNNTNNSVVFLSALYGAMSANDGYYLVSTTYDPFRFNQLPTTSVENLWPGTWKRIAWANYAIEGLNASQSLSQSLKNQLLGEAKFMRAWLYFYLVNYWGDVPLVLSTDALNTGLLPRAPVAQVYRQIVQDLTDAKNLLATTYPSLEKARANKNVASALLGRVYFYQQNWGAAEAETTNVISTGGYSLVTNLNNVFLNTSTETIWQISLAGTSTPQTVFGSEFIPAATTPTFVLYDTLANTFEANDQRKVNWTKSISYIGKIYYYPYKYKVRSTTTGNEYPVMFRLSEMHLIRSEARANQNNISGAQADLNLVRNRAGLPNTTATTQAQLLAALEHERWVEFFTEFGDRWFNLKRLNTATAVLNALKPAWQPFQQLYPIPQTVLTANPNLVQNPGY